MWDLDFWQHFDEPDWSPGGHYIALHRQFNFIAELNSFRHIALDATYRFIASAEVDFRHVAKRTGFHFIAKRYADKE